MGAMTKIRKAAVAAQALLEERQEELEKATREYQTAKDAFQDATEQRRPRLTVDRLDSTRKAAKALCTRLRDEIESLTADVDAKNAEADAHDKILATKREKAAKRKSDSSEDSTRGKKTKQVATRTTQTNNAVDFGELGETETNDVEPDAGEDVGDPETTDIEGESDVRKRTTTKGKTGPKPQRPYLDFTSDSMAEVINGHFNGLGVLRGLPDSAIANINAGVHVGNAKRQLKENSEWKKEELQRGIAKLRLRAANLEILMAGLQPGARYDKADALLKEAEADIDDLSKALKSRM